MTYKEEKGRSAQDLSSEILLFVSVRLFLQLLAAVHRHVCLSVREWPQWLVVGSSSGRKREELREKQAS